MKKEKTIDFHIKWCWHAISRMYNMYASQNDMSMAIGYVLLNIDTEKGTPATKIGPSIGMEPRSLTRMLKALEEKGWIYRETDKEDKRYVNVFLTEEGKARRNFARAGVIEFNNRIQEVIPAEKLAVFYEVIQQIKDTVEEQTVSQRAILQNLMLPEEDMS
ncbi:MAG: MarR family winged helix-turn-helix transcriptional regulator [Spirosomataceae bacterium]